MYLLNESSFLTIDDDECLTNPCHSNATCDNIGGSYICKCSDGFTGNGMDCTDKDECIDRPCHRNATCTNIVGGGGHTCACNNGFTGNGMDCKDKDECIDTPCHANATCTNIVGGGGYMCSCMEGYTGNGTHCTGKIFSPAKKSMPFIFIIRYFHLMVSVSTWALLDRNIFQTVFAPFRKKSGKNVICA